MLNKNIKTVYAKLSDSKFILNLRNSNYIRKNSLSKNKICSSNHAKWLNKNLKKKNILIIHHSNIRVGYIRWSCIMGKKYLSWAITKKMQGNKIGGHVLKKVTAEKSVFRARILKNNLTSLKIAINASFKIIRVFKKYNLMEKC
tara:strand:- start:73 stop:504 length:432 start_codon:yes stop_codon:yes gene_type:complete